VVRSPRAHHASSPPRRREGFHRLRGQDVPPHPSRHGRADLGGALRPALGASGYTYAEAMATQQLHDRIAPVLRLDSSVACHSVLPHRRGLHGALAGFPCAAWQLALGCRFALCYTAVRLDRHARLIERSPPVTSRRVEGNILPAARDRDPGRARRAARSPPEAFCLALAPP